MATAHQFETPENIQVEYAAAGLGTRFLAWFVDQFILTFLMILFSIVLILAAGSYFAALADLIDEDSMDETLILYVFGVIVMVWGLGSFAYFGLSELFLRGQTIGKRMVAIRVVTADGFQLDPSGIFVRNIFRVLDQMPPLWLVPLLSSRSQRTGDMVAGTIVVSDESQVLSAVRAELSQRSAADAEFRIDASKLSRLTAGDFEAIEKVLDRISAMSKEQRIKLLNSLTATMSSKLEFERPDGNRSQQFLEDILGAEFRRQDRSLA